MLSKVYLVECERENPGGKGSGSKEGDGGFAGGSVPRNPPANAGDTGSIPRPGRSHTPRSN